MPGIFTMIQKKGRIKDREMFRTFNMGLGLVVVVSKRDAVAVAAYFKRKRIQHYTIGRVVNDTKRRIVL